MTSNVTLFKTYKTDIFLAIEIIQLTVRISILLFEKQKHQYNHRITLHSNTAQCIFFLNIFSVCLCKCLKTVTRLNKRSEA